MSQHRTLFGLLALLFVKAIFMILWIRFSGLQLAPDEAQYWVWSQYLDWGYYSKPPGIAWEIWLGTFFLGDTVIGVRIGAVVLSFLISLSVYWLALSAGLKKETAFWAGVISALTPMGFFASYYATTDIGMIFFWTLACVVIIQALRDEREPHYLGLGLIVACGALFKWPIYLIWILVFGTAAAVRSFRSRKLFLGVLISLLGFLPTIIWNAGRGWPTFQHVWATIQGGSVSPRKPGLFHGNFLDFFGAQAALMSPIFYLFLIAAFVALCRYWKKIPLPIRFCGASSLGILLVYQVASLFQKIQGNWCVFVYPMATVFLVWYLCEFVDWGRKWLYAGLAVSLLLIGAVFWIPIAQLYDIGPEISLKLNRFNECMGWGQISPGLREAGYDPETEFLASNTYQMSSLLSFYSPGQKRAYFLNLEGRRKNQFSYWPSLADEQLNRSGLFVIYTDLKNPTNHTEELEGYFDRVTFLGQAPLLVTHGHLRKAMLIYRCEGYNGTLPKAVENY